jgi:ABC-type multidrug transport system fused ATPase/permease subunit
MNSFIRADKETEGNADLSATLEGAKIEFRDVNFAYPQGETILHKINLTIEPGQIALLTGPSGGGKSSMFRLLTGAFKHLDGKVLIDGLPISNYKLSSLRQNTGVLLNQFDIFRGSLLDNISMGDPQISIEEIMEVAKYTGLISFIQSQLQGFDTLLDPLGKRLTQSIRQRILLTRSLMGKSRLLVLEEPFQQLNPQDKINLLQFIRLRKSTAIIIAKDKDLSLYDVVFEMNAGKLEKIK